jgi:hypothetical protein
MWTELLYDWGVIEESTLQRKSQQLEESNEESNEGMEQWSSLLIGLSTVIFFWTEYMI